MKKNAEAGSQMTANQDETTCRKVLNRRTDKYSRQIIDAENCFRTRIIHGFSSVFIDCDTLQAAREMFGSFKSHGMEKFRCKYTG